MSRTTRKPQWYCEHNDVSYINRELEYYYRFGFTESVKRRRPEEEYQRDVEDAEREYQQAIAENGGTDFIGYRTSRWTNLRWEERIRRRRVSRYRYEKVEITEEEAVEDAKRDRSKQTRDGRWNETTRNTGFKRDAKKATRHANKRFCKIVLADDEHWEDTAYPNGHEGDTHVWNWW